MLSAPINCSSMGANPIVTGVFGKRIRVVGFILSFSGSVNATWQTSTGSVAIGGPYYGTADKDTNAAPMPDGTYDGPQGHFETLNQGDSLILNLSAAVAVGGHVTYILVP